MAKLGRLSVGVADQIVSSGSNFLAMVLAARLLSVDGFGAFSLAMLTYSVVVGVIRSLCYEAILVRPGDDPAALHRHARQTVGSAVMVGLLAVPVAAAIGVLVGGDLRAPMLVVTVSLPVLILQDALRFVAFARREPAVALASDVSWLVGQLVGFGFLQFAEAPSAAMVAVCWGVPSVLGAAVSAVRLGVRPTVSPRLTWVRDHRDLSLRYLVDFATGQGSAMLAVYALAGVSGVTAVASVRGAQTLFGPVPVLQSGVYAVLVPELRRTARTAPRRVLRVSRVAGIGFVALALAVTGLFWMLPDRVGVAILGETWYSANALVIPIGLAAAASGMLAGASLGLRSLAAADAIVRVRLATMPAILALPVLGAFVGDAVGGAYGIFAASAWSCVLYWYAIASVVARRSEVDPAT